MQVELASLPQATIKTRQETVGSTRVELSVFLTEKLTRGVLLKALNTNSNTIYIGNDIVDASTGFPLSAGESIVVPLNNGKLYAISDAAAQKLAWMTL